MSQSGSSLAPDYEPVAEMLNEAERPLERTEKTKTVEGEGMETEME